MREILVSGMTAAVSLGYAYRRWSEAQGGGRTFWSNEGSWGGMPLAILTAGAVMAVVFIVKLIRWAV